MSSASNPIRILFIIDRFSKIGGAEKNLLTILHLMDKKIFEPHLISFKFGRMKDGLDLGGNKTMELESGSLFGLKSISNAAKYIKYIRVNKIEVVVSYFEASDYYNSIFSRLAGASIILSNRRDTGFRLSGRQKNIYALLNKKFDCIFTVSEAVKESMKKLWDGDFLCRIQVIPNGVDTDLFRTGLQPSNFRRDWGISPEEAIVGMIAIYRSEKRHEDLIRSAKIILQQHPRTKFLFVGGDRTDAGSFQYETRLKSLAKELGIEQWMVFPGTYQNSSIPELIGEFDVLAMPSTTEGMSNTLLEAMACSVPVVATAVGGNVEVIEDGISGFLVPPRDPDAMAEKILNLMNDPVLAREIGDAGRERILKNFSNRRMIEAFQDSILELYSNAGRKRTGETWRNAITKIVSKAYLGRHGARERLLAKRPMVVLCYHRIGDGLRDNPLYVKKEIFEKQLELIINTGMFSPVRAEEFDEIWSGKIISDKRIPILITFDDGYRDNLDIALPLLKKYGFPALLFMATDILYNRPLWYDILEHNLEKDRNGAALRNIREFLGEPFLNGSDLSFKEWVMRINNIQDGKYALALKMIRELNFPRPLHDEYLSIDGLHAWHESGMSVGAHACSHPRLSNLPREEAKFEIIESKKILGRLLGEEVRYFAYPFGEEGDFLKETIEEIKFNGFSMGFSLISGLNVPKTNDRFAVRRICMNNRTGFSKNGSIDKELFIAQLLGIGSELRRAFIAGR